MVSFCVSDAIEPGQEFGPELFTEARKMQDRGVRFEVIVFGSWVYLPMPLNFVHGDARYRRAIEDEQLLSQFAGCVLDLLRAREDFREQREHLNNASDNLAQFVGDGEAREIEIHGVTHRISNVDDSITIVKG